MSKGLALLNVSLLPLHPYRWLTKQRRSIRRAFTIPWVVWMCRISTSMMRWSFRQDCRHCAASECLRLLADSMRPLSSLGVSLDCWLGCGIGCPRSRALISPVKFRCCKCLEDLYLYPFEVLRRPLFHHGSSGALVGLDLDDPRFSSPRFLLCPA